MVELPIVFASAVVVFFAAVVQGATGFGFVIVAAPILASYIDPKLVVPVMVVQGLVTNVALLVATHRHVVLRRIWLMMVIGACSTPLGTFLLVRLDSATLKVLLGLVVGIVGISMLLGFQHAFRNERLASVPVAAASGVLTGATGLAGAPIVLFFTNQGLDQRQFRANVVAYLQMVSIAALPSFVASNVLTGEALRLAAVLLPASGAGVLAGMWLAPRISLVVFRRLTLVVVIFSVAAATISGFVT